MWKTGPWQCPVPVAVEEGEELKKQKPQFGTLRSGESLWLKALLKPLEERIELKLELATAEQLALNTDCRTTLTNER